MFFELIQVALGARERLSQTPTKKEWQELYDLCQRQSVVGLVFPALDGLSKCGQKPPLNVLYEWIGWAEQIKQQNIIVNQNAVELCKQLEKDGFGSCILKGQGNASAYPNALSRTPGDIDVWVKLKSDVRSKKSDVRKIIKYVKGRNHDGNACYHHIDYGLFNGTEVEVHYRPSFMFNPVHNFRLQHWFGKMSVVECLMVELPEGVGTIRVPNREFNIVFQLSHIYNHLLHEGIGLRQIIDYYYVLKSDTNATNGTNYHDTLRYLGLQKIAGAMMWVLNEKLDLEEEYLIAPKDEERGRVLLAEIMRGGNFGFYDADNIKASSRYKKNIQRVKRDLRMMRYFPSECLWEPIFRMYHLFWRMKYN